MRRSNALFPALAAAALCAAAIAVPAARAQAPAPVKIIPPAGIAVPDAVRAELTAGCDSLRADIEGLRTSLKGRPALLRLLPDVEVYEKAVRWGLADGTFYKEKDFDTARAQIAEGRARAAALKGGKAPWLEKPGPVVLGYVSRIDGSVQPYGLVIPDGFTPGEKTPRRLDFFFHGRGENLTELSFIEQRARSAGEFTPAGAFVLHPYGRFCNANRFAGETDLFEALDNAKARFAIDPDRVVVRGFSMGGAACWQFTTHYASLWAAAAPGAGFTESAEFTNAFGAGKTPPPWYVQTLWHLYDAVDYAANVADVPTVAYSGEIDRQKQAADKMAEAMAKEGMTLTHVIGPQTGHSYHPDAKKEINAFVDAAAAKGRDPLPATVRFTTWTLRYPRMAWVAVDGLAEHWKRARVEAAFADGKVTATTENVASLSFDRPGVTAVTLDGQAVNPSPRYARDAKTGKWKAAGRDDGRDLRKRPGLQGPIDDAFYGPTVFVRPTGTPLNPAVGAWTLAEMERARQAWHRTFRGDIPVVDDTAVTDEMARTHSLVLWGDPQSNRYLARVAPRLPVRWDARGVRFGDKTYDAATHVPELIYPNPLAKNGAYVVVNSGFTWIDYAAGSNAEHAPKLPDWAVRDITRGAGAPLSESVADAGFFDERWRVKPAPAGATPTATAAAGR
jgi:dienelactone hydrolase